MADLDQRVREYIPVSRIVWHNNTKEHQRLLTKGTGQTTIVGGAGVFMPFGASIVLDFGKELHGGVQIISGDIANNKVAKMRIRFGESVSEVMNDPNNDHAIHDTILDIPLIGWTEFGSTGFRFVRLDQLTPDYEVEIKEIRAVSLKRDLPYKGEFESSDQRLNDIWNTGAYTTHLCMQDFLWDGIKRDRIVWMGDMHPEAIVAASVFGRVDVVERSMDYVRNETEIPRHMNGIGSYSLWWIITQRDWFRFHGAMEYLEDQRVYLKSLLEMVLSEMVSDDGTETMQGRRFLDWPSQDNADAVHAGLHALLVIALDAGAELCMFLSEDKLSSKCKLKAAQMRKNPPKPVESKQVNALLVLAGISDPEHANIEHLANDAYKGISTFYGYYVLQARALAGDYQGCLDLIRTYWGGMLDLGATTFWEHFELDWLENSSRIDELPVAGKVDVHKDCGAYCFKGLRHSLCHGWASGPTAWLSEHVLGVKILKPGASEISIDPHLGDLSWVRGVFPTPYGKIEIEHIQKEGNVIKSNISLPKGVRNIKE